MRKFLTAGLAALTLGGSVVATTTPAAAAPFHGGFHGGFRGPGFRGAGPFLVGGLVGLGVGAALAGPYYGPGYYYGPGPYAYGACYAPRQVWDPYAGRYVIEQVRYAC
jgi:hypothetical protein